VTLLVVPLLAAIACASLYGGTDVPNPVDAAASTGDAGPDRVSPVDATDGRPTGDAATDSLPSCNSPPWPGPPDAGAAADAADLTLVLAGEEFDFDPGHGIGLNLDGVCTCPGPDSCTLPPHATKGASCDDPNGVDPVLNRALLTFDKLVCLPLEQAAPSGYSNLLLKISGYNGLPDDDHVIVELFISIGTPPMNEAGAPTPPKFDGTDVWQIWDQTIAGTLSKYADITSAYVSNSVLVASPVDSNGYTGLLWRLSPVACAEAGLPLLGSNPLIMQARGAVITGQLVRDADGGFSLQNGLAGARVATDGPDGFLAALDQFGLCRKDLRFLGAQSYVCDARDIALRPSDDNQHRPCNAVSFALGFTATPAMLGSAAPLSLAPSCDQDASSACPP
jgi:hypothetical protein